MKNWKTAQMKELFEVLSKLDTEKDMARFMRDVATISELKALSERWEVAKMLHKRISYREISKKTGVSTATITRVAHWIKNGEGGYRRLLEE